MRKSCRLNIQQWKFFNEIEGEGKLYEDADFNAISLVRSRKYVEEIF